MSCRSPRSAKPAAQPKPAPEITPIPLPNTLDLKRPINKPAPPTKSGMRRKK